jgi:hypothetical protein
LSWKVEQHRYSEILFLQTLLEELERGDRVVDLETDFANKVDDQE